MSLKYSLLIILMAACAACGTKKVERKPPVPADDNPLTYFSMYDFVKDQWEIHRGQPYVLTKFVTKDGKTDSSMVSVFDMDLGSIMQEFIKTDIGDKKFIGKYDFSVVDDASSFTRSYYYEANEPDLYTRTLQITTDPTNGKIKSVFVKASDNKGSPRKSVKLYYSLRKVIQIQELIKPRFGAAKEVKTEYRFPQDDSSFE